MLAYLHTMFAESSWQLKRLCPTHLFAASAKALDDLSVQLERKWRLRPVIRPDNKVARSVWSHCNTADCFVGGFETCMLVCHATEKRKKKEFHI